MGKVHLWHSQSINFWYVHSWTAINCMWCCVTCSWDWRACSWRKRSSRLSRSCRCRLQDWRGTYMYIHVHTCTYMRAVITILYSLQRKDGSGDGADSPSEGAEGLFQPSAGNAHQMQCHRKGKILTITQLSSLICTYVRMYILCHTLSLLQNLEVMKDTHSKVLDEMEGLNTDLKRVSFVLFVAPLQTNSWIQKQLSLIMHF